MGGSSVRPVRRTPRRRRRLVPRTRTSRTAPGLRGPPADRTPTARGYRRRRTCRWHVAADLVRRRLDRAARAERRSSARRRRLHRHDTITAAAADGTRRLGGAGTYPHALAARDALDDAADAGLDAAGADWPCPRLAPHGAAGTSGRGALRHGAAGCHRPHVVAHRVADHLVGSASLFGRGLYLVSAPWVADLALRFSADRAHGRHTGRPAPLCRRGLAHGPSAPATRDCGHGAGRGLHGCTACRRGRRRRHPRRTSGAAARHHREHHARSPALLAAPMGHAALRAAGRTRRVARVGARTGRPSAAPRTHRLAGARARLAHPRGNGRVLGTAARGLEARRRLGAEGRPPPAGGLRRGGSRRRVCRAPAKALPTRLPGVPADDDDARADRACARLLSRVLRARVAGQGAARRNTLRGAGGQPARDDPDSPAEWPHPDRSHR